MIAAPDRRARAERTRLAILEAAEQLFAARGYAATRLEDVAQQVGIRRASIIYYFKDKPEIYDAVLESVFGGLFERIRAALVGSAPLRARMEAAIAAWVDYVGSRPTFARLLLREAVDSAPGEPTARALQHIRPFFELIQKLRAEHAGEPPIVSGTIDPLHLAAIIGGSTLFLVGALPMLVPSLRFDPLPPQRIATHRDELLRIVRTLLDGSNAAPEERDD